MNDDLISRSALKKVITANHYLLSAKHNSTDYGMFTTGIIEAIDNAPTDESVKELYEKIETYKNSYRIMSDAFENEVRKNRPTGEWIPVSERLPDYMDDILITFQKPNREPLVYRAVFIGSKFALDNGDTWNWNDPEIKAWMPLPEAYKETEND